MDIAKANRREAYENIIPRRDNRKDLISSVLMEHPAGMTAEEITDYLFQQGKVSSTDRNNVKPRLTEMRNAGAVRAIDRRVSPTTGRKTTVWQMAECQ